MRPSVKAVSSFNGFLKNASIVLVASLAAFFPGILHGQAAISCPAAPINFCGDQAGQVCVDLPIQGADSVVATGDPSVHWADGKLCFTAITAGAYTFQVQAFDSTGVQSCTVGVNVGFGQPPQIICPTEPVKINLCSPGQVCLFMATRGQGSIRAAGATYDNGNLCFQADTSGVYKFIAVAANPCGADTCHLEVLVTVGALPVVTCPSETFKFSSCTLERTCVPLPVSGADSVIVSGGAVWSEGQVCFLPDTAGTYTFNVTAYSKCGKSNCTVHAEIVQLPKPKIVCPAEPFPATTCGSASVCVPVAVQNADRVVSSLGTYGDGSVCFTADTSGTYSIRIVASNNCGSDSCSVAVVVTRKDLPIIACPTDPLSASSCTNTVCLPLSLKTEFTDSVKAVGATLTDDNLCFTAGESGLHRIPIEAFGPCGTASCTLNVNVQLLPPTKISCLDSTLRFSVCSGAQICLPLPIANADSVTVSNGTWNSETQSLCFTADKEGEFDLTVTAKGLCNRDSCHVRAMVSFIAAPSIACPQIPLVGTICKAGQVCVDLPIANATQVTVNNATWKNDQLCFQADSSGLYGFGVNASNQCHSASCSLSVHVEIAGAVHACFTSDYGGKPLTVKFSNCTTPAGALTYLWSFGDGATSAEFAPTHTYEKSGCYPVTLAAQGLCGNDTLRNSVTDTLCVQDSNLVVPTDQWINVYCGAPTLDGVPLKQGDVIAAYDPQGVLCGLDSVRSNGAYGFMPIYRDDQFTPKDEGAVPGDTIRFAINGHKVFTQPPVIWTANGDRFQTCNFLSQLCSDLVLGEGWHLISWNVPMSGDIGTIFGSQMACIDLILSYDRGGLTFDPNMTKFSTLANVDFYHGYWIKVKPSCTLTLKLCGAAVTSGVIPIYQGWNLVSYWPTSPLAPGDALRSLGSLVIGAWGFDGAIKVYQPGMTEFNTLDSLRTFFGYWVKVTDASMLIYPGFAPPTVAPATPGGRTVAGVTPTRDWLSLYGESITLDGAAIPDGAEITAYTVDGVACGKGVYTNGLLKFMPVYGRDGSDAATKLYAASGDEIQVYVNGQRTYPTIKWEGAGQPVRLARLSTSSSGSDGDMPRSFSLAQNFPNPFNPSTTIGFSLPTASNVTIEIFNVKGERVTTLVSGPIAAGNHSIVWNGVDASGSPVASGVYLYRLHAGSFIETRKMILLK